MKIYRYLYAFIIAFAISGVVVAKNVQFSPTQVKAIQQIIHEYLVTKPEVLIEASHALQQQQMQATEKQAKAAIEKYASTIFADQGKPIAGNPNGDVVVVAFSDYQCPHCKEMGPIVDKLIKANSNLKVIFMEWPIFGENSEYAAKAAIAAMQQNKYYDFHVALTAKGYPLSKNDVLKIAKSVGLDINKLQTDIKDPEIAKQLGANFILAKKLALIGTPAFVIGNPKEHRFRYIGGQTDQATLQQAIDDVK